MKGIKIARINHRDTKKELEFVVQVAESSSAAPQKGTSTTSTTATTKAQPKNTNDDVPTVTNSILAEVFAVLKEHNIDVGDKKEAIQTALHPRIKQPLTTLKNTAYAHGFTANQQTTAPARML